MPIQRQYSLPTCVLILEGLNNSPESAAGNRPELSVLTRFECHFAREKETLVGGRDLLEGLVHASNDCVQAWMSGVKPVRLKHKDTLQVELQSAKAGGFNLMVPTALLFKGAASAAVSEAENGLDKDVVELHISSIQLFDLIEAVDQLTADRQTLPELQLPIQPRSRREARSPQVALEQSAPIALGAASVAVAAAVTFFMPVPKVPTPPKEPQAKPAAVGQPVVVPTAAPPQAGTSKPAPPAAKP